MATLCMQIEVEKDHAKYTQLVKELNEILDRKEKRFLPDERIANPPSVL